MGSEMCIRDSRYIDLVLSMDPRVNPNINVEKEEFNFNLSLIIANDNLAEFN